MKSLPCVFLQAWQREMVLHWRQPRYVVQACLFFILLTVFFPLTLRPEPEVLRMVAPGIVWVGMLFALLLSAERLFHQDYEEGVLEQWLVSGYPLPVLITGKVIAHWLVNCGVVLLFCPLLGILFYLTGYEIAVLCLSLLCGTPAIVFLCALAAVCSAGIQQRGVLMALILLPLTIPVMIFGSGAVTAAMQGLPVTGYWSLLLALSLVAFGLLPFAIAGVARISLVD